MAQDIDAEDIKLAQPLAADDVQLQAWYMDDSDEDQRLPHQQDPNIPVGGDVLNALGILSYRLNPDNPEQDHRLAAVRKVRGYDYVDVVEISPQTLADYEIKLASFYEEHIHDHEEIRFMLAGSGYFDFRDREDKWIRIACKAGDMLILPAGSYHRFTLDDKNYAKAMRLFDGPPVWTPINRSEGADIRPARQSYLGTLAGSA